LKRVIIITYYWPPAGGSGVQRWLKYSKYLPEKGWKPIIYTPENPEYPVLDDSLTAEIHPDTAVIRRRITEPFSWYKRLTGRKESVNIGFMRSEADGPESRKEKIARWIRGNVFIPDARLLWIYPSRRFLKKIIEEEKADAVISTGPPHSMHLIALGLKKKTGVPWLADFRDPWTGIDFYDDLLLTSAADALHHRMERKVLQHADVVTTVSHQIKQELVKKGADGAKTFVIPNGYDEQDLPDAGSIAAQASETRVETFTLLHSGSLVPSRNPVSLWKALALCCKKNDEFRRRLRIRLVGSVDGSVHQSLKAEDLLPNVEILPYKPHKEAFKELMRADVLLLLINRTANAEGFLSGKVFEYLLTGRPVLCVGPEKGEAAGLLRETAAGVSHAFDDVTGLQKRLLDWFHKLQHGESVTQPDQEKIRQYSRRKQAGAIAGMLNEMIR
jgi:glycosyltransferase involved in cell wall biosynthesis